MKKPVLVIMAAGLGSRFGGLKQLEAVGPSGEVIMDYSIFDAKRAGFEKVVFIIKREDESEFKKTVGNRAAEQLEVEYAYQELTDVPKGFAAPAGRVKPWGTTHAVLAARSAVKESFAVINADDYYGLNAFVMVYNFLVNPPEDTRKQHYVMAGYYLEKTLSDHGAVTRGVCEGDGSGRLTRITECSGIERSGKGSKMTDKKGNLVEIPPGVVVSMNFWGFENGVFKHLQNDFEQFIKYKGQEDPDAECLLPASIGELIMNGIGDVRVLSTKEEWHGITYKEDLPSVKAALAAKHKAEIYPSPLWKKDDAHAVKRLVYDGNTDGEEV
ncbi:MAG: nucleotidyltransferase [Clostridiales bacterium]|jgi:NDP-sugar pyrophosphorylase family protein|nr:nucleotidyltransferase [Clostridiales bacterium]